MTMPAKSEATARPWKTLRDNFIDAECVSRQERGFRLVYREQGEDLAYILPNDSDGGNANAALIVEAVNQFDALVRVAEAARLLVGPETALCPYHAMGLLGDTCTPGFDGYCAVTELRAALAAWDATQAASSCGPARP